MSADTDALPPPPAGFLPVAPDSGLSANGPTRISLVGGGNNTGDGTGDPATDLDIARRQAALRAGNSGDELPPPPPGFAPVASGPPAYEQLPPAAQRFSQGAWDYSLGGALQTAKGLASLVLQQGMRPGATVDPASPAGQMIQGIVQGHVNQAKEAQAALDRGDYTEAFGHSLATIIPFAGPMAGDIADTLGGRRPETDKFGNITQPGAPPDPWGALGKLYGLGLTMGAGEAMPEPGLASRLKDWAESPNEPPPAPGPSTAPADAPQGLLASGQQHGVRLSAGDVLGPGAVANMEVHAEKVPFAGVGKFRAGQQAEAKAAAQRVTSQYLDKFIEAQPANADALIEAAKNGDERARNTLDKIDAAGNDPDATTRASIAVADWTTRQEATRLYDKVQSLAESHDLGDVSLDSTKQVIDSSLAELRPAKLQNSEVIGLLQKIKASISPKTVAPSEGSNPFPPNTALARSYQETGGRTVAPDNSYGLIRQLHSDLGDRIRDYYQGNNQIIGEKGVGYLERVQNAIEDDMRGYASESGVPEVVKAGDVADQYYKTARVPFKNGQLASASQTIEPDQIFQQFIKAGKGDRAQNFYDALDDRGRAAVRYNMVAKAVDGATDTAGVFSPRKFSTSMAKLKEAYGVFFKGTDKFEMDGFNNLMGHIARAGQYAENPPTGQRVIPYLMAGGASGAVLGAFVHPAIAAVATAGTAALTAGMRFLFTSEAGRGLLLRAAGLKPGSAAMDLLWKDKVAPQLGTPPAGSPPTPPAAPGPATPAGGAPPAPETGPFGPIFREQSGKPAEAIAKLQQAKTGEVPHVWHNADLARATNTDGWIDLAWGDKRGGLSHIISKHVLKQKDLKLDDLARMIPDMKFGSSDGRSVTLESPTHQAAVRLDYDGQAKRWLVSAYEK